MAFYAGAVILPLVVMVIGAIIREYREAPQSAAAELPALLILLDGAMILDAEHFSAKIAGHSMASQLIAVSVIGLLLSAALWFFCLLEVEPQIMRAYNARGRGTFPLKLWCFAWASAAVLLAVHLALLTGRLL